MHSECQNDTRIDKVNNEANDEVNNQVNKVQKYPNNTTTELHVQKNN